MELDLASTPPTLRFSGLAGDAVREIVLPGGGAASDAGRRCIDRGGQPKQPHHYYGFVSMYNRGASFTIVEAQDF